MAAKKDDPKEIKAEEQAVVAKKFDPKALELQLQSLEEFRVVDGDRVGLESVDRTDIKIPVVQLLQPLSEMVQDEKGKAGQFYDSASGECFDSIPVTLLSLTKTRVRWDGVYRKGAKPLCRSFDGEKGVGDPGIFCNSCKYSLWDGNNKPECSQGYNWLMINLENGEVCRYTAISSGVKPTKQFLTDYMKNFGKYQLFVFKVLLSSEKVKNEQGVFFIPKYEIIDTHDAQSAKRALETLESYKDMLREDLEKDIDSQVDAEFEVFEKTEEDDF